MRVISRDVFYRGSRSTRNRNEEPFVSAASSGGSENVSAKWLKLDLRHDPHDCVSLYNYNVEDYDTLLILPMFI